LLRHRAIRVAVAVMLMIVLIVLVTAGAAAQRLYTFGQAISSQAPLSTGNFYMLGAGRVNLLVLGYGGPGHGGAYLTDSLMVISLIPSSGATTLISVPRDLWVQIPPGSGKYGKINAAYEYGLRNGYAGLPRGQPAAAALAARKVSDVIGVPVTNWLAIDFQGFRKLVDALGGVDVNVPTAFTARYPRADDESLDPGTKIIQFAAGTQHMNGERAIEYARARYVLTPASEGSDFARSLRQQILVRAILARAKQMSAWPRLSDASKALEGTVKTNLSLADLGLFAEKMNFKNARHVGLSTANVLTSSTSADGQYILLPTNGDWTAIRRYVNAHLGQ
jgi:LCP family protein required for cell wall assembly